MALAHPLSFGDRLKRERLARGLTQEALAERAGLSTRAISDLERGINRAPRKETLRLLADALQLSAEARSQLEGALRWATSGDVLTAPERGSFSDPSRLPLAGRAQELVRLAQHLAGEGPPLLLLAGEPGIGKSRLLRETAQRAFVEGWTVLEGGCHRQSGQQPYTPVLDALAGYLHRQSPAQGRSTLGGCAWLVRLLPELAEHGLLPSAPWKLPPEQERRLMFAAVRRYLANIAGPAGTVLVLDDLQWAGADALELLSFLVRAADQPPLRVVGAYRNNEVSHQHPLAAVLADLAQAQLATQVEIGPLEQEEAAKLLAALFDEAGIRDDSGDLHARVVGRAGGVPFFLVSCTQAVRPGQSEGNNDGTIPWDIAQSIGQRVATLPGAARELLAAAAVVGRVIPDLLLTQVVSQSEAETLGAIDAVLRARLLVASDANSYQFAHDLIREVVAKDLNATRRKVLHRRVAEALERHWHETPAELLAYHFGLADDQVKAIIYIERAGDRAQQMRAYAEAEAYYRDLIARLDMLGRWEETTPAQDKLGQVLYAAARYDAAAATFEVAAQGYRAAGNRDGWARTLAQLGWAHANRGTVREGRALLELAIEQVDSSAIATETFAELNIALAYLCAMGADHSGRLVAAEHAATLARTTNDRRLIAQAEFHRASALTALDRADESLASMERVIAEAEGAGDLLTLSEALDAAGQLYEGRGEFDKSMPYMDRAVAVASRLADPVQLALLMCNRGQSAFYVGDWETARKYHERAVEIMRSVEDSHIAAYPYGGLGLLSLAQGQSEVGLRYLHRLQATCQASGDIGALRYVRCILAEYDLLEGRADVALTALAGLLDQPGQEETGVIKLLPLVAWAHLELERSAEAKEVLEQWLRRVSERKLHRLRPDGLRIMAMLAHLNNDWDIAVGALEEALALCEAMGCPYSKGKALYVYAALLAQRADVPQARARLETALFILDELGERMYARHARQLLDELPPLP